MKHYLKETDLTPDVLVEVFSLARKFKRERGRPSPVLSGQTWALIFAKSSTRTRVSFEVGINELGGHPLYLNTNDIQLGRGESIEDTARVLSRFVHGIIIRTFEQSDVERLSGRLERSRMVNALTDFLHPCQICADAFTAAERWAGPTGDLVGSLRGRKIAFLGDTNFNMANSWILGASLPGMRISLAGPKGFEPGERIRAQLKAEGRSCDFQFTNDPLEAVVGADIVYTDVWASMGQEKDSAARAARMRPFSVSARVFDAAKPDALFMHCLPAHPGEEVDQAVLDNPRSVVFDEAENRLHVQKAILSVLSESSRT